jgi:hypothetical protein
MNLRIIFVLLIFNLLGCKGLEPSGEQKVSKACTLVGSSNLIRVEVVSTSAPLPANLAFSINGNEIEADECNNNNVIGSYVQVNEDRSQATVSFLLDGNKAQFEYYFPNGAKEPQTNSVSLGIFSRASCSDQATQIGEINKADVSWHPVYINGKDCGTSSYGGDLTVEHIQ